ncbi:uncharacterized protein LOC127129961 [Lathyrus oleraceus]|uniref:uncharacterized protein LOC127129961 n=1 Tax=Pisum sativum TaxID=3888 RepID=UPI0021D28E62|nr:uncharacterized protein LOC127129961 [Pisum sativum]
MAAHNIQFQEENINNQRNTTTSIKNLEIQMGQIAQQLVGSQAPGTQPSGTMINPREHNNVEEDELLEVDLEIRDHEKNEEEVVVLPVVEKEKQKDHKPTIRLPYSQRTKKKKNEKNFEKFLEMFKKLEINIPFSKGMKIPIKKKDIVSVTIPCTIGNRTFKMELIDLGASVSLMPLSIYKKLVDFVILEMPKDEEIPLILGRLFLESGWCMIGIEEGMVTLKVYDEELKIDV